MSDTNLVIGNEHDPECDEDAIANFHIAVLSYHDKEIELGIYVYCSDCDRFLGKTIATVTLSDDPKTGD